MEFENLTEPRVDQMVESTSGQGAVSGVSLPCPKCAFVFRDLQVGITQEVDCPSCKAHLWLRPFAAGVRSMKTTSAVPGRVKENPEAGSVCFFHEEQEANVVCGSCGRMLCSLCDLEIEQEHYCSPCLEKVLKNPAKDEKGSRFQTRRAAWDSIALILGFFPLFLWPLTMFTGPLTLALGIYGLRRPKGLVSQVATKVRLWLAIALGAVQTGIWVVLGATIFLRLWNQ